MSLRRRKARRLVQAATERPPLFADEHGVPIPAEDSDYEKGKLFRPDGTEMELELVTATERAWTPAPHENTAHRTLTPKQEEILRLVAQGMTTQQIAVALGSSPATVRTHVGNILARLGAHTRAQAVAMMLQDEGSA